MAWTNFQPLDPAQAKCNSDRYTGVPHSADNEDGTWHGYRQGDELVGAVLVTPSVAKAAEFAAARAARDGSAAAIAQLIADGKPAFRRIMRMDAGTDPWPTTNAGWTDVTKDLCRAVVKMGQLLQIQLKDP